MGAAQSAPPFEGELPEALASRYFKSSASGLLLHHRTWPAVGAPKAVVYLVHGLGEHVGRYTALAAALTAAHYTVHALDLAGHGASHGERGYVESLAACVADVLEFAARVAPAPPGAPRFLLGHSFGGLVALRAAQAPAGAALFRGAVLSAPALVPDPALATPFNVFLARHLTRLLPKLPVAPLDARKVCSDARVVAAYERDPLVHHGAMRVRTGQEISEGMDAARAAAPAMALPLLLLHGTADELCLVAGSRALAAARAAARGDCALVEYGGGALHEILNEPGCAAAATAEIIGWLDARAAPSAAAVL